MEGLRYFLFEADLLYVGIVSSFIFLAIICIFSLRREILCFIKDLIVFCVINAKIHRIASTKARAYRRKVLRKLKHKNHIEFPRFF